MKKIILSCLTLFATGVLVSQVAMMPLIEHFTQASCGPCASANPVLASDLNAFGTANYVRISHQVSWPGFDPMYNSFPTGPDDRVSYYGITGVPNTVLQGGTPGSSGTVVTASTLATTAAMTTPYQITATQTWNADWSITLDIDVVNTSGASVSSADKIYVAMIEDHVTYPSAPGSNGETDFEFVMREMYDASTGAAGATSGASLGAIAASATESFSITIPEANVPTYLRDLREISFAVYVQNNSSKTIHQAAKSAAGSVPSGRLIASATATSTAGSGYCDYSFTPGITYTNDDATTVTEVIVEYDINGGAAVSETYTGSIASGASQSIAFPATTLSGGASVVNYRVISANGGGFVTPGTVTIDSETYYKLNASSTPAPVTEGMESAPLISGTGYSQELTTAIFSSSLSYQYFAVLDGPFFSLGAIGGFAASNRSILFNFYNASSGSNLDLVMHPLNMPASGSQLKFAHAYCQYTSENDRLKVDVSTDCGATWSNVFNKAGSTLMTIPAESNFYIPELASEWAQNIVDLSAYDGASDVVIRFRGTSAWGNNLYVDDINVSQATSVIENEQEDLEIAIMPNPANEYMVANFTLTDNIVPIITIVNSLGQQVKNLSYNTKEGANSIRINTSELSSGIYFFNLVSNDGTSSKRFIVE